MLQAGGKRPWLEHILRLDREGPWEGLSQGFQANSSPERHRGISDIDVLGAHLVSGEPVSGKPCLFPAILQLALAPLLPTRLFFFTFNLHCKLERNELHPPGSSVPYN